MTILSGADRRIIQKRATRKSGWTKARRTIFLDTLAMTCNVRRSAADAGLDPTGAYALRRRDPTFAALWEDALEVGAARLNAALLAHSLSQIGDDDNPVGERAEPPAGPFDPYVAIKLLQLREARNRKGSPPSAVATLEEVDAALTRRIAAIAKRLAKTQWGNKQ